MKNRFLFLTSLFLFTSYISSYGQKSMYKGDELYATVNSIKDFDFGFAYKLGLNNNWFLRFDVINASFANKSTESSLVGEKLIELTDITDQKSANYDLGIGIEKRVDFNTRIEFLYGLSILGGYDSQKITGTNPEEEITLTKVNSEKWSYGAGVNIGVLVKVAENLFVSGELLPKYLMSQENIRYQVSSNVNTQIQKSNGNSFNFDFKDIRLSLVYRFRR